MEKWRVEIEIGNIEAKSDTDYQNKVQDIVNAIKALGDYTVYVGVGESDD